MKLLVLSPVHPDAPSDGDRVRLYHWIEQLRRRHEIHLIAFGDAARPADRAILMDAAQAMREGPPTGRPPQTSLIPTSLWRRRMAALLRLLSPLPVSVTSAASSAMARAVDAAIAGAQASGRPFDAVLCYRLKMAPYALRFRGPRFLDYTDSLTRYAERRGAALALAGRPLMARWWRRQARQTAAYEAWCAGQFDGGFFNSRQDCEAVRAMAPASRQRLHVAANGVALPRAAARRTRPGRTLLFVGHLAYAPNAEAVAWFADEVLPLVRQAEPAAEFVVVGGDAPAWLQAYAGRPGLRFTGPVPAVAAALAGADVSVCPVRTGAGRQNKLLEAFAAGVPAVATTMAAEGAEAVAGRDLLAADGAPAFAAAVLRLLREPALRRRLAAAGSRLVRRLYRWDTNAAVLERVMAGARRPSLW